MSHILHIAILIILQIKKYVKITQKKRNKYLNNLMKKDHAWILSSFALRTVIALIRHTFAMASMTAKTFPMNRIALVSTVFKPIYSRISNFWRVFLFVSMQCIECMYFSTYFVVFGGSNIFFYFCRFCQKKANFRNKTAMDSFGFHLHIRALFHLATLRHLLAQFDERPFCAIISIL